MGQLQVRGASLEFSESGSGDALILVHGSVSDFRTWEEQQARLSSAFRVIAYSRRYHWPNAPIPVGVDYPMAEHVEDLDSVLEVTGAKPAHVVGHSYGAYLALLLAIQSPGSVRSLVLAEPPAVPLFVSTPPKPKELLKTLFTRPSTATAIIRFGAKGIGPATAAFKRGDRELGLRLFGTAVLGKEAFASLSAERLEQVRANLIDAEFSGSGFAPLPVEAVARVRRPTLLLGSENSPSLFRLLLNRLQEVLPHVEREEIPGASHIMHEDNPDAFFEAVSRFLESQRGAS